MSAALAPAPGALPSLMSGPLAQADFATRFGPGQQFVSAGADRHGARAACRQGCRRRWRWHGCSPELLADLTRWLPNQREARARHVDPPLIPARGVRPDLRAQRCVSVRPRGVLSRSDVHDHISSEAAAKLSRRSCNRQSGAQVDRLHGGARIQCPRPREPGQAKGTHTGKVFYALNCVFEENAAYEAIVKSVVYVKPKWFPGKIGVNQMGAVASTRQATSLPVTATSYPLRI